MNQFRTYNLVAILGLLIGLMSCGGGKAPSRKLEISNNFVVGANGFAGGMVVMGTGPSGAKIFQTAIGGTRISIEMVNGLWDLTFVGWDGASAFQGESHCSSLQINLETSTTDIYLDANPSKCSNVLFAKLPYITTNANGFKPLAIYSCGVLKDNGGIQVSEATPSTSLTSFCANQFIPRDMQLVAKSARVAIPNSSISSCISSPTANPLVSNLRVPSNKIPLTVNLYENENCVGESRAFNFPSGLYGGNTSFSSYVVSQGLSNSYGLALPMGLSGWDTTPMMGLLPQLTCGGSFCLTDSNTPLLSGVFDFVISEGGGSNTLLMSKESDLDCSSLTFNSLSGLQYERCDSWNDGLFSRLSTVYPSACSGAGFCIHNTANTEAACTTANGNYDGTRCYLNTASSSSCTSMTGTWYTGWCTDNGLPAVLSANCSATKFTNFCPISYSINGGTTTTKIVRSVSGETLQILEDIYRGAGGISTRSYLMNSISELAGKTYSYGLGKYIRESLGVDGPFAMFGRESCLSMTGTKEAQFTEDGEVRRFKVIATSSGQPIPKSICNNTNKAPADCNGGVQTFQKRLIFQEEVSPGIFSTKEVMDLHCDFKIGTSQGLWEETWTEGGQNYSRVERERTYWNTQNEATARIERYRWEQVKKNNILDERRLDVKRAERMGGTNNISISSKSVESKKEGANFSERMYQQDLGAVDSNAFSTSMHLSHTGALDSIYTHPLLIPYQRLPPIRFQVDANSAPTGMQDHMLQLNYREFIGTTDFYQGIAYRNSAGQIKLHVAKNGVWKPEVSVTSTGNNNLPRIAWSSVTEGQLMITYYDFDGTNGLLKVNNYTFGNSNVDSTQTAYSTAIAPGNLTNLAAEYTSAQKVIWSDETTVYGSSS